ncbi:type II toxin-antitoxin system HipA family toxin [Idiomarina tyrosinivorans]|uniref:Type II toxin-antitoxin system HipA family toxin n=1 Tax=Idiomarina tyrosinivorans TaxID=1445662 RepID=A0A432ZR00_9GAMM|nr:type II toxin-antitoxin system HipA family toxin [Idiomarina tyrosinivorans]RUO80256.1 type II toxin-antitoxin system HipA family toxin [Idiomarina tyrosinivorans]
MTNKPIQKLDVSRTLTSGRKVSVGVLAQNKHGVYFQYHDEYLKQFHNLSPFSLVADTSVQRAPDSPHQGLHGVFSDSLPDGWGLLLQNRVFRQRDIAPERITAMDRLAFVGDSALGALTFSPMSEYNIASQQDTSIAELGLNAQRLFDGQTDEVLAQLVAAGSSGGARPKANVYVNPNDPRNCRTRPNPGDEAWLVKFTSANLALGHEEGMCEAAYLTMAARAGLQPPEWRLIDAPQPSQAQKWLALKRFDYVSNPEGSAGRMHLHSACGLLDADFRAPSLDYQDLIKATAILCKSPAAAQRQFRRAIFNLLVANQDDHSKNWAFMLNDNGQWQPAPFYDVTYSPHPFDEHATSYAGYGKQPPLKALKQLADSAGYARWSIAQQAIEEMFDVVAEFAQIATDLGVRPQTIKRITQQHQQIRKALM